MSERRARLIARAIAVLTLVLVAAAAWLIAGDRTTSPGDVPLTLMVVAGMTAFAMIGTVIAARAPANPIGWLYAAVGLCAIFGFTLEEYAIRGSTDLDVPWVGYAKWVSSLAFSPVIGALLLALLLFPNGSLPSPRWRVAGWTIAVGTVLAAIGSAFVLATFEISTGSFVENPMSIGVIESWRWITMTATVLLLAGTVATFFAVVLRFLRSRDEERQQLRWLAFAVVMVAASCLLFLAAADVAFIFAAVSITIGLPGATAIAVLRYRLYDLDLVIKKTVIFGITVVLIMIAGVAMLLVVSGPLTAIAPDETLAVGLTGLVIGGLSWPLWRLARRIGDRLVYGGRTTPSEALNEFRERLSETYASDDVLPRMAAILGQAARASEARVWLRVAGQLRQEAAWPADASVASPVSVVGGDLPSFPGVDHAVEIRDRGELLGALTTSFPANDPIDGSRERLVHDLASQAGLVLRNVRLIEELRASRQRLVAAQDAERRRLERNIHDGAQQQLVALGVKLRLADSLVDRDQAKAHELLATLQAETHNAIEDLRDLARGIYPPLLADKGLASALTAQARKAAIPTTVEADDLGRYPQDVEAAVYFTCLEALNNTAKYAEASHATITLAQRNGALEFTVSDDGRGFDRSSTTDGTGLQGIADRLDAIGGTMQIESAPGAGTTLVGVITTEAIT